MDQIQLPPDNQEFMNPQSSSISSISNGQSPTAGRKTFCNVEHKSPQSQKSQKDDVVDRKHSLQQFPSKGTPTSFFEAKTEQTKVDDGGKTKEKEDNTQSSPNSPDHPLKVKE